MGGRPYILAETSYAAVREANYDVVVLPWGATEAHNLHLPYATDVIETERVAAEAARRAWERGSRLTVLPAVPFGVNTGQLDLPLCMNMNPSTQAALLADIVAVLEGNGLRKLVLLNGHGGNDFRAMVRELQPRTPVFVCVVNWYACLDATSYFDEPGDHAGELETSVMLHLAPDLVQPLATAGTGKARPFRIQALRERWAWAPRAWTRTTSDTGIGDPSAASAAKGARFFDAASARIADFLCDLAAADLDDLYG